MKSIPLVKKLLELVEMTSGLVNSSFSLPKWQAVKMNFFAPCHVFSKNGHHGKLCYTFFSLEKLALLSILKEVKPSPNRKMIKLLTFDNSFRHYDILTKFIVE